MLRIFFNPLLLFLFIISVTAAAKTKTFVFLGDSLTEGYGVAQQSTFPQLIQQKIKSDQLDWKIISSGSSSSTSASALSRLKWVAKDKPEYVMILLGSNDGLRGFKPDEVEKNLTAALEWAAKNNIKIILGQMNVPPNYGRGYQKKFADIFPRLAKKFKVELSPFILEGVYGQAQFNLQDGIHPNEKGYKIIADNMYLYLKKYLK